MSDSMRDIAETRHPSVGGIVRFFEYDHLRPGLPRALSATCAGVARHMLASLPDSPELTAGLRKLLEAKDCFVRAGIDEPDEAGENGTERPEDALRRIAGEAQGYRDALFAIAHAAQGHIDSSGTVDHDWLRDTALRALGWDGVPDAEPEPDYRALLVRAVRELADSGSPQQNALGAELARDGGIEP